MPQRHSDNFRQLDRRLPIPAEQTKRLISLSFSVYVWPAGSIRRKGGTGGQPALPGALNQFFNAALPALTEGFRSSEGLVFRLVAVSHRTPPERCIALLLFAPEIKAKVALREILRRLSALIAWSSSSATCYTR